MHGQSAIASRRDECLATCGPADFLAARCAVDPAGTVERAALREEYERWARERDAAPVGPRAFAAAIRRYAGNVVSTTSVWTSSGPRRGWRGLRLLSGPVLSRADPLSLRLDALNDAPPLRIVATARLGSVLALVTNGSAACDEVPADLRPRWGRSTAWVHWGGDELAALRRAVESADMTSSPPSVRLRRPNARVALGIVLPALARAQLIGQRVSAELVADPPRRDVGAWTLGQLLEHVGPPLEVHAAYELVDGTWREVRWERNRHPCP